MSDVQPMVAVDQVVTREAAPAALEQLRADRVNGNISEERFHARMEYLQGVMNTAADSQPPAPPRRDPLALEERFDQQYAAQMQGVSAEKYINLRRGIVFGQDADAFDERITHVLARGQIPQHLAGPLLETMFQSYAELADMNAPAREIRVSAVKAKLEQDWGPDYRVRLDRVNDLIATMFEGDTEIGALFDRMPYWLHANASSMDFLDRVASQRARERK